MTSLEQKGKELRASTDNGAAFNCEFLRKDFVVFSVNGMPALSISSYGVNELRLLILSPSIIDGFWRAVY